MLSCYIINVIFQTEDTAKYSLFYSKMNIFNQSKNHLNQYIFAIEENEAIALHLTILVVGMADTWLRQKMACIILNNVYINLIIKEDLPYLC